MDFNQKQTQNQKQLQRLIMLPQMQQAIQLMQMPIMELSTVIEAELEQNPVLEYDEELPDEENKEIEQDIENPPEEELKFNDDFEIMKKLDEDFRDHFSESENFYTKRSADEEKLKSFLEQSIQSQETLFEHLMAQAKESFETPAELAAAEVIIGSLDENGYLKTPLKEISLLNNFNEEELYLILSDIQTFEPFGVGARDLRECLLIQLKCRKESDSIAYKIIELHFDDLLNNRIPSIKKGLHSSVEVIQEAIQHKISHLDLHPGTQYSHKLIQHIVPDVIITQEDDVLSIVINDDHLPTIRLNTRYLRMLDDESLPKETKEFIRNKLISAKWLLKNIDQRNDTIFRVMESITKHQKDFFYQPNGKLVPLTMKVLAEELELHESTIARSVSNKYVDTPRGLLPIRYFFSNSYTTAEGTDISSKTVRDFLKKLIDKENKKRPLSDEALSKLLEKKGVPCARRTVAKYRTEMHIGNAKQRKEY
jgi:RNA polymerase sigma-54 factor